MAINTEKSQLGVGSGNILSWDTIDKLKEADTKALVKPLETKIQDNLTKQKDLTAITTLLSTFKANVSNLTSDNTYLRRDANATGSGSVSVTANAGVAEQNMSLSVQQLATHDSYQSKTFELRNGTVFDKDVSFGISIGGKDYVINADSSTTLEGLAEKINEATEGKVQAKILNVGGAAGAESFRLVIQSAETGSANAMSFYSISSGGSGGASHTSDDTTLEALGFYFDKASAPSAGGTQTDKDSHGNTIQRLTLKKPDEIKDKGDNVGSQLDVAKDAKFKYNGIDITRSSNTVDDLILGVSLTLNKVDKEGESTNVNITQSTEGILEDIKAMVESYNSLINNINEATKYDSETGLAGTFQGVREITSITTELNKIINGVSKDGKSLADFGITLTKDGLLTLDSSMLNDMINTKFDEFKSFFSSETKFTNVTAFGDKKIEWDKEDIKGTLTINGVDITIDIPKDNTGTTPWDEKAKKNALLKAIANASGLSDISASFDKDGKLVLKGSGGVDIEIKGDSTFLGKLGLKEQKLDGKTEIIGGFFKGLNDTINGLIGTNGTLTTYEENLTNSHKSLTQSKEQRQKELDTKYTTMAEKWSQYDTIIAKLESQMNTVNGMIEAARNANK